MMIVMIKLVIMIINNQRKVEEEKKEEEKNIRNCKYVNSIKVEYFLGIDFCKVILVFYHLSYLLILIIF